MAQKKRSVDRERYRVLKEMLGDRRREVQEKLRSLRETLPVEAGVVRDAEEQSVDDFVTEVDMALMQMKSETLSRIDQAIARLENGTYGLCQECDEEISARRLKALPFAALCRTCQEDTETTVRAEREARAFARLQKELVHVTLRTGGRR
ncbi:MAG: TraR/DksA family transcriptional regulator [Acidobacteria bacterium]|jgi:DnaK suppressor protein|nr:TraR/DksA family transcriptional regulator [Acidobacteriota bacterium]